MTAPCISFLCLDNVLDVIHDFRTMFEIPEPYFGLEQVERIAGARKALSEVIEAMKTKCGQRAYSRQHFLLKELGPELYVEEFTNSVFSGYWRLSPLLVEQVFRRVFEMALQTLCQLPAHDPRHPRRADKLASIASRFNKLAEVDHIFRTDRRIREYMQGEESRKSFRRLLSLCAELRWAGALLNSLSLTRQTFRIRIDSPNPQVRFVLYLAGWIEACTGRKHYKQLRTLAAAAFAAGGRHSDAPKWVDRLEIEMNRKMMKRRRFAKMIASKS